MNNKNLKNGSEILRRKGMLKSLRVSFYGLRNIVTLVMVLVLVTGALWAQQGPQEPEPGKTTVDNGLEPFPLFESEEFARSDFNTLFEKAAAFISQNPDSPQALLLLDYLSRFSGRATNFGTLEPVLEAILEKDLENGFNEERYREMLARFYRKRGLEEKARNTRNFDGYVLDCLIIGPFGNSYRACLDVPYEVEKDLLEGEITPELVKKKYVGTDEFRKISWIRFPYEKPVLSPSVSPFSFLRPSGGCAYALAQVELPEERSVLIDIDAGDYFKLWVNRTKVLDINGARKRQPDSHLVFVDLKKGINHILVKLPGGSFSLALRDSKGHLLKNLKLEDGLRIHPVEKDKNPVCEEPYNGGTLKYYTDLVKEKQSDPLVRVAHSFVLASHQLQVEALEEAQEALDIAPENVFIAYYVSRRYETAPHYPRTLASNKAKELWDRVVKLNPGFILAHEKIADRLAKDLMLLLK